MRIMRLGLVLGILSIACPKAVQAQASLSPYNETPISLLLHLDQLGTEHDVFFTIESSWQDDDVQGLATYPVPQDYREAKLEDELQRLCGIVPNLSFQPDEKNPRVIHAIDRRLGEIPGYGMEHKFDEFNFSGDLDNLPKEISRRGIPMVSSEDREKGDPLSMSPIGSYHGGAMIHERAPRSVRSILSGIWGLEKYSRVLWTATTERGEGAVTTVRFRGERGVELRSVPLGWHLRWLAGEHDVFFTVEQSWATGEANNGFVFRYVRQELTRLSLSDELQRLSGLWPDFHYEIDGKNPRIIHIRDARLGELRTYSLDQTVHSFVMKATVSDLVTAIGRQGIPISNQLVMACSAVCPISDHSTVVNVKADATTVRSLLTDFLPVPYYSRILWTAETERREGSTTQVAFGHTW